MFYALVHFPEAQCLQRSLLACRTANRTSYLCNFKLFHLLYIIKLLLNFFLFDPHFGTFPLFSAQNQYLFPTASLPSNILEHIYLHHQREDFLPSMIFIFKDGKYTVFFFGNALWRFFFYFLYPKAFFLPIFIRFLSLKDISFLFFRNRQRSNVTFPFLK